MSGHHLCRALRRADQLQNLPAKLRVLRADTRIRRVVIMVNQLHDARHPPVTRRHFVDEIGERCLRGTTVIVRDRQQQRYFGSRDIAEDRDIRPLVEIVTEPAAIDESKIAAATGYPCIWP